MLERATSCLESGGRQLFRTRRQCMRTRRMLHSAFWHHGANDLWLPSWWTATSTFGGDVDDSRGRPSTPAARTHDGVLLDFLYPAKTIAFIRRLSIFAPEPVDRSRRQLNRTRVRQFSTTRWQRSQQTQEEDGLEALQAQEELEITLLRTPAIEALQSLLNAKPYGKQELAWRLYSAVPESDRTSMLKAILLEYLSFGDLGRLSSRILEIFEALPSTDRRASSYRVVVAAYVTLRMIGPAIQLYEEAAGRFDTLDVGVDVVFARTIHDDQWDLSLRILKTTLRQADRLDVDPRRIERVFSEVPNVPDLVDHLQSFLAHAHQYQHELSHADSAMKLFTNGVVPHAMTRVIDVSEPDEDFIWDFFTKLFDNLHSLGISTTKCYEHAINYMLGTNRYRTYTNQRKIHLQLYRMYRERYLANPETFDLPPSKRLLRKLMMQHGAHGSLKQVQSVIEDLRIFYGQNGMIPQILRYLVSFFAEHGDVDRVQEHFDELRTRFPKELDLQILSSLIYVRARRMDVAGATQQFRRIRDDFGQTPDTVCWNVLLLAYTRTDDLDGALECFNNILDSGIEPDKYTFGPLLDLCANRGDIEAFEALYSRARQLKIPLDSNSHSRSGYVQVFLNADDPEGAEITAHNMLRRWKAGSFQDDTLTYVWNILIQYYALEGDVTNSRRLYKEMTHNNIPLNTWTYAALMRSLIEVNQTNAAWKILRVTMPMHNMRAHAFHYAICMTGFVREGQYDLAVAVHKRMIERQIPQTESSQQAALLALGVAELQQLKMNSNEDPRARLQQTEQSMRQAILSNIGQQIAHRQPRHSRYIDSLEMSSIPKGYFGLLIMLYSTRGAYDICKELFEAAHKSQSSGNNYEAPISLLTAIMQTHYKAGEYEEVAKCWDLAYSQAERLVKTFQQALHPQPPAPEFNSIVDPAIKERYESSQIAVNRRQILWRASRIYIRSLLDQQDGNSLQHAQRTIRNLLVNGFKVDTLTWNEFIQHLARHGRLLDAFSACEEYLMPRFPGWRDLQPFYRRKDRSGYQWMELRHFDVKRATGALPKYRTLVVMAAAFKQVRQDEANGLGYEIHIGKWMREMLEEVAPMTVRAIETMPRTGDRWQRMFLQDN